MLCSQPTKKAPDLSTGRVYMIFLCDALITVHKHVYHAE